MKSKPTPSDAATATLRNDRLVLVVYAPFGSDEQLSTYPDGASLTLQQHPLYQSLLGVAKAGVNVCALIDRVGADTVLVEIPAGRPARVCVSSCWKQDMASPRALAGLLRRAHACHPKAAIALALEGHGAGYLPEIDRRHITHGNLTNSGGADVKWEINPAPTPKPGDPALPMGSPILPMGSPILPMGSPILPMGSPILPSNHMPMSTWGLGEALRLAREEGGVPRISVVHLNNCFNMAVELLHTLAPHADHATGYGNYNFFTAGQTYPGLFQLLRGRSYSAEDLARGFALGNGALLQAKKNHPTVGGAVDLRRMAGITECVDKLAGALLAALAGPSGPARDDLVQRIAKAITASQAYDTDGTFRLEMPDQMVDLLSLAVQLQAPALGLDPAVTAAAKALQKALARIRQYGAFDRPWLIEAPSPVRWDFRSRNLAMNILLPDPDLRGLYDWRSPFYLNVAAETDIPAVQPHVIDFLKGTDWAAFIKEYHRDVPFKGLLPALIPEFPVFEADYKPGGNDGNDRKGGQGRTGR